MEREKPVSVESINIKMGGREITLSIEEAKKLKKALEEIFGIKVEKEVEHIHHHDYWRYWGPYYVTPRQYSWGDVVYFSTAKGSLSSSINGSVGSNTLSLSIK